MRALLTSLLLPFAFALSMIGCAQTPRPEPTLYERLGGREMINAIVVDAIGNVSMDKRINARFIHVDANDLSGNLVDFICARTGGPCVYKGRNMADSHDGMRIRDEEFDALVEDLLKSMDKFKVPGREQQESVAILARMRNAIVGH